MAGGIGPTNGNLFSTVWTQGQLITVTVYTLDIYGNPQTPDYIPTANLNYITSLGTQNIFTNRVMSSISNSFYYINVDSTYLAPGSYVVTTTWSVSGQIQNSQVSLTIVAFDGSTFAVNDPITRLRIRLRDLSPDPVRWIWSDQDISEFLNDSLSNWNSAPPLTNFYWMNLPLQAMNCILLYGEYLALQSQANKLAAEAAITYSDRGLQVNKLAQAQYYKSLAEGMFERAEQQQRLFKRSVYSYGTGYISMPNATAFMSNIPLRAMNRGWAGI